MSYYVYISGSRLPVNPESITISRDLDTEKYRVLSGDQVVLMKGTQLAQVSFKAEFPHKETHYSNSGFKSSDSWVRALKSMQKKKKPVRFIASNDIGDEINMKMILTGCDIEEKAGEEGDKYASISLLEYKASSKRVIPVPKVETTATKVTAPAESTASTNPAVEDSGTSYTVKSGDTLWKLAKQYYGDGSKYTKIAEASGISNPNLILTGQTLTIPKA